MTQITINIENAAILPRLKEMLNSLEGVSIATSRSNRKSGIEEAYDDIRAGRITHYNSAEDLYKAFGI